MPWYNDLRPKDDKHYQTYSQVFPELADEDKPRIIRNLLRLREGLLNDINPKIGDKNLILATWNIKEFGHYTKRTPESYFYIAEIVSKFDLIAIQEIKSNLDSFFILLRLLGSDWDFVFSDITEGDAGNSERFGIVYNKKRVNFSGLAGEIVLWDELTDNHLLKQLKRTPYITGFKAGWKSFATISVHLNPDDNDEDTELRKREIKLLTQVIIEKINNKRFWTDNLIIIGDFNLYSNDQALTDIIYDSGFEELDGLRGKPTNVSGTEVYDRIFLRSNNYFTSNPRAVKNAGIFNMFDYVYQDNDHMQYVDLMRAHRTTDSDFTDEEDIQKYFNRYWKRFQLSDHFPIWIDIEIDSSNDFLQNKLARHVTLNSEGDD